MNENSLPNRYPRDLHGYGSSPPDPKWPGGACIAVQFVLNYEEGGENNLLHGDECSEAFLSEIVGAAPWPGQRHWNMESMYEYGARAGFWRLHRLFTEAGVPVTVYGVATALKRSPSQVEAMLQADWEIASHGLKWIEHKDHSRSQEQAEIAEAVRMHELVTGSAPRGWYTGRTSMHTVELVTEHGGFDYVSDSYADDLPYWFHHAGRDQLVIPYALDCNDMRFATAQGFNSAEQFFNYMKDTFDTLYREGQSGSPKMMNIGLHCRLAGRPGRAAALSRFLEYIQGFDSVWLARRTDMARHWKEFHPPARASLRPTNLTRDEFISAFGGIFEHSAWIAEQAFAEELGPAHNTAIGLHSVLALQFRAAGKKARLGVLNAHPDLAGKLAAARKLTEKSGKEQAGAGLDTLTDEERKTFTRLNEAYRAKFSFPFIIAVKGMNKMQILDAFNTRLNNTPEHEFETACKQVERIALLRLQEMLPAS